MESTRSNRRVGRKEGMGRGRCLLLSCPPLHRAQLAFRFSGQDEPLGPWAHALVDEFYGEDSDMADEDEAAGAAAAAGGAFSFGAPFPAAEASVGGGGAGPGPGVVGRGSVAAVLPAWMTAAQPPTPERPVEDDTGML